MNFTIYVLKLQTGKYYIGKTKNFEQKMKYHFGGIGSSWTYKYPPVELLEYFKMKDKFDEDRKTIEYMEKYGIQSVRGGSFSEDKLSIYDIYVICKTIKNKTGKN